MSSNSSGSDSVANPLKLTDLIEDCLEHIFMYLNCTDLFRIAHTNKQLQSAAALAFGRKFGKKIFRVHILHSHLKYAQVHPLLMPPPHPVISEHHFDVYKLKPALRLLRCFGSSVAKLHIQPFDPKMPIRDRDLGFILRYTVEYCSESLVELSMHHIDKGVFDSMIIKPFIKVKSVEMVKCTLDADMTNFNARFPALQRLELVCNGFEDSTAIGKHFHRLKHLKIIEGGRIQTKSIREALRLNPQLRSFTMERVYSPEFFRYASKYLPNLNLLKVRGEPKDFGAFSDNPIRFKVVKNVEMGFMHIDGTTQTMPKIKLSFDQLEDIILDLGKCNWNHTLVDFLEKHQTIKKVTLRASADNTQAITRNTLTEVVSVLPGLNELKFFGVRFPVNDLIEMVEEFNFPKCSFCLADPNQLDNLRIKLGKKWVVTDNRCCVIVERNQKE